MRELGAAEVLCFSLKDLYNTVWPHHRGNGRFLTDMLNKALERLSYPVQWIGMPITGVLRQSVVEWEDARGSRGRWTHFGDPRFDDLLWVAMLTGAYWAPPLKHGTYVRNNGEVHSDYVETYPVVIFNRLDMKQKLSRVLADFARKSPFASIPKELWSAIAGFLWPRIQ